MEGGIPLAEFVNGRASADQRQSLLQNVGADADSLVTPGARVSPASPYGATSGATIGLLAFLVLVGLTVLGLTVAQYIKTPASHPVRCVREQEYRGPPYMFINSENCLLTMRFAFYDVTDPDNEFPEFNTTMLRTIADQIERQCNKEVAPNWGIACEIKVFTEANPPDDWTRYVPVVFTDVNEVDFDGACAYHCEQTSEEFDCNIQEITDHGEISIAAGQPWIAAPLGLGEGVDGMLNCAFEDFITYGKAVEQSISHTIDREILDTMMNAHVNTLRANQGVALGNADIEYAAYNFSLQEISDPVSQTPGYSYGDNWVWLSDFVLPDYFDGCTDAECVTAVGPYDLMGLVNAALTPFQGTQSFWRYSVGSGNLDLCVTISPQDDPIDGLYVTCDRFVGPDSVESEGSVSSGKHKVGALYPQTQRPSDGDDDDTDSSSASMEETTPATPTGKPKHK